MNPASASWSRHRAEVLLDPDSIYLNAGSFSPLCRSVWGELTALRAQLATSPSDFHWRTTPPLWDAARTALAQYLNFPRENLLLLPNATFGVNVVTRSLPLRPGDEILTTDHEYGAMLYCWQRLAKSQSLSVRTCALPWPTESSDAILQSVADAMSPRTRVLFFSHVTSPTGMVLPARELCALAAEKGVLCVVDGAHAPGMIPLDLATLGADFYAGNCHKWLMGPAGSAFLAVHPRAKHLLEPLITSWGWEYPIDRAEEESGWGGSYWARNFEFHGTTDRCPLLVLPAVLSHWKRLGETAIHARTRELSRSARAKIGSLGFPPAIGGDGALWGSMSAFVVPPVDVVRAREWLWREHRIEAPFTSAAGRCHLRVSTAWFNTPEELDRLADAMARFPHQQLQ